MYLIFDVETNGLPPIREKVNSKNYKKWPRIVQLAYALYDENRELIQLYDTIIKPDGFIISEESSKIHGITTEIALKKGIDIKRAIENFFDVLDRSKYLICHNFDFDYNAIISEYYRNNIKRESKDERQKICTMIETVNFCKIPHRGYGREKYKWPKLMELHQILFNEEFGMAHNALYDVKATAKCFWELVDKKIINLNN